MRTPPRRALQGGQDLLEQAAVLEAFISRQQRAGKAAAAQTSWLVQEQALAQEEADCEAQLWASCHASPAAAAALQSGLRAQDGKESVHAALRDALSAADGCVGEAVSLSSAASALLAAAPLNGRAPLAALQQQIEVAQTRLRQQLDAADAAVRDLLRSAPLRASSSGSDACGTAGASLQEQLQVFLQHHPLAAKPCTAQLLEQAAELEARWAGQRLQRRAAVRAFLAGLQQWQRGKEQQQQRPAPGPCPAKAGSAAAAQASDSSGTGECWPQQALGADGDEGAASLSSSSDTLDGWTADEQAVFLHARRACMAPGGGGEAGMVRQLVGLLPARNQQAVLAHEKWHKEVSRLQTAAQQCEAGWRQESAAFLAAAAVLLAEQEVEALAGAEAALTQLETAAACLRCAGGVEQERAARAEQQEASGMQRAAAEAEAAARRFNQWQARESYRGRLEALVEEHHQRQVEQAAAGSAAERAATAAAAREAAAAAAKGKQRAAFREQCSAAKQAARQQERAARQAEEERRQAALDALRRRVAPAVGRDEQRATGPTQSSVAAGAAESAQHGVFTGAVLGFSNEQVLRDQRFQVYEALRQLGLHTSAAGRQAVAAARPARALRPDMLTSGQRQGLDPR